MEGYVVNAPDTLKLKVFCIEEYRRRHGLTASETMELFYRFGVLHFLENPILQYQRIEDTVPDVEEYISVRS